jgi:O-antigen ligase
MTTRATHPTRQPAVEATPLHMPDVLVIGGALVAPLNLLIFRSFTIYDLLVFVALLYLLRAHRFVWPPAGYLAASYVFMLAALVSAFRATYATEALTQVLQYAFIFFIQVPVVISVVTTRARAVTTIALLCLGTLAAILHAYVYRPTQGAGRVVVFYSENPNRLGYPAAYLIPLLLVLWLLSRHAQRPVRIMATVAVLVGLYLSIWAVTASGSRSSLLGAGVALIVVVVIRPGLGPWRALGRLLALVTVCGVIGFALVASGQLPNTLEERIDRSLDSSDTSAQAHLVGDREHLANAGMLAFLDTPLVGTGLDNFRYIAPEYDIEATPQLPHNLWLQLGVQVGAIGTAAFGVWLLLWAFDVVGTARRANPFDVHLLWGIFAAMAGILTIFMFAPEMLDRHYWLIAALGLAAVRGCRTTFMPGGHHQ